MNQRLKELSVSLKNLKEKIPTADDDLNIRIHWDFDDDLTFQAKIPLNKNFNKRR